MPEERKNTVRFSLGVAPEIHAELLRIAKALGLDTTGLINMMIREALPGYTEKANSLSRVRAELDERLSALDHALREEAASSEEIRKYLEQAGPLVPGSPLPKDLREKLDRHREAAAAARSKVMLLGGEIERNKRLLADAFKKETKKKGK